MVVLAALMAGTSWAVAEWVSGWLVLPYLLLMAWLLNPSPGRPQGGQASEKSGSSKTLRPARPAGETDGPDLDSDATGSSEGTDEELEPGQGAKGPRARRGKGRVKKVRAVPDLPEAAWIQVAPGKFVRVESPGGSPGPHDLVGDPAEVAATPRTRTIEEGDDPAGWPDGPPSDESPRGDESVGDPSWPSVEAEPLERPPEELETAWVDPLDLGPEDDPTGDAESESWTDRDEGEAATPKALDDEKFEGWPGDERDDQRADEGGDWLSSETPELTDTPAFADASPWETEPCGVTFDEADPTETAVDETVLDDASPFNAALSGFEVLADASVSETQIFPASQGGPARWPRRLASGALTRVGPSPRPVDRESPPRRLVRSHGPARRPPRPGRLGRRGPGRTRRFTRAFPPRSPPSGRRRWRRGRVAA